MGTKYSGHDDECTCRKCTGGEVGQRGFKSYEQAKRVTSSTARALGKPYWLVLDHSGLYQYVQAHLAVNTPTRLLELTAANAARQTLRYLGAVIVDTFDAHGQEMK